jgi:hypothetical protein
MVTTPKPLKTLSIIVVALLLWAPLMPALDTDPFSSYPGPTGAGASGPGGSFIADEDGKIDLYSLLEGSEDDSGFGQSLTNLWDVNGDELDDLIIGSGYGWLEYDRDFAPWPTSPNTDILFGREDRDYDESQLEDLTNITSYWSYHSQRWLGDVNGDGHYDLITSWDQNIRLLEDGTKPYYEWNNALLIVRYGSEDGFPDEPDLLINLTPPEVPEYQWIGYTFGGVGDVNGDGIDDLFVFRNPIQIWNYSDDPGNGSGNGREPPPPDTDPDEPPKPGQEPTYIEIPADFQLYYGSEDGLPSTPSWNATPEQIHEYWSFLSLNHADLNGDGYSDIILSSSTAPHIIVYNGGEVGLNLEPDREISFGSDFTYGWTLHTPVDMNGDAYDDLIIDYNQPDGLFDYIQYIAVFLGNARGIPTSPSNTFRLDSESGAKAVTSDFNGDGLVDIIIYSQKLLTSTEGRISVKFTLHFNNGGEFPDDPAWRYTLRSIAGHQYPAMSDSGDFDGDGLGDAAIGIPGVTLWRSDGSYYTEPGHVLILHGAGIMDFLKPLSFNEGPVVYAEYKDYDFLVNANPTGLTTHPGIVNVILDPDGVAAKLTWNSFLDDINPFDGSEAGEHIQLLSDDRDQLFDADNNTVWLHFRVRFGWGWPHEDLSDVRVELETITGGSSPYIAKELFRVENDLDLLGDIHATGGVQGTLQDGDWVQAGETVTVSGPVVVYEGTTDIYPPSGVCDVVLQDDDGTFSKILMVSGEAVELALQMDDVTDLDENLTLSLQDLPGTATAISQPRIHIRVDGDLPFFTNVVPGPDDWHSSSEVWVSITADDRPTAGVASSSLEYSYSVNGGSSWSEWTRTGLETTGDGPTVDGLVVLQFPDGENNFVRWRVMDLVGNGFGVSEGMRIKVDTINVTYTEPFPDPGVWQTVLSVEAGVTISDMDGAGIQVSSIQYRLSNHNLSGYGDWIDWDEGSQGDAEVISVSALLTMAETPFNYIQWRARDIAGNGYTTSTHFKVMVDATSVTWADFEPLDGPFDINDIRVWINVTDSPMGSGVDLTSVDFRMRNGDQEWNEWVNAGMPGTSPWNRISQLFEDLPEGENRVQFRASDVAGNGPAISEVYLLTVDTEAPVFGPITPGPNEKQDGTQVTVTVTVSDAVVGLDLTNVMYRFSTTGEAGLPDEWQTAPPTLMEGGTYQVQIALELARGVENIVQFKANDLLDHLTESEMAVIWVNRLPTAAISSPGVDTLIREGEPVQLSANGSSDPDDDELNYTWFTQDVAEPLGHGRTISTTLSPGTYNLILVVKDDVGAEDTVEVLVTVEKFVPPKASEGDGSWILLLVLLVAILGGAGGYYMVRQRSLTDGDGDEWEELA